MKPGDRVKVIGPTGRLEGKVADRHGRYRAAGAVPPSAQLDRRGNVLAAEGPTVAVRLDGEERDRNFSRADLEVI